MLNILHRKFTAAVALSALAALVFTSAATTLRADDVADLETNLKKLLSENATIDSIAESPMPSVYEVSVGNRSVYVYSNGDYLLIGEAYEVNSKVSLLDQRRSEKMKTMLTDLDPTEMIVMPVSNKKTHITVFTDIDCGYCRKLHQDIPQLSEAGLEVRYLMFPRAGIDSESYDKAVSAWCAPDKAQAITKAKNGEPIDPLDCDNPVSSQYRLGIEAGVTGTPTIITADGKVIPGYVPPDDLLLQAGVTP